MKNISFAFIQEWFKGLFNRNKKDEVQGTDRVLLKRKGEIISTPVNTLLEGYASDEEVQLSIGQLSATLSRLNTIYVSTIGVTQEMFTLASQSNGNAIRLTPSVPGKRIIPLYILFTYEASSMSASNSGFYVVGTTPFNSHLGYMFYLPETAFNTANGNGSGRFIDGAGDSKNNLGDVLYLYGTNNSTNSGFSANITGTMSNIRITTYYTIHG